jgi:predicted amidohydrolase YtcJ
MPRRYAAATSARITAFIVVAIVGATLIAGLIVGAQRDDSAGPVDLIVYNAQVYKGDGTNAFAEAVAVRGAQILRVGSNREIKRLRRAQTTVIDAHGGSVVPGFNDSHVHFLDAGLALGELNLLDATTVEDVQNRIRLFAEQYPDRPWVIGRGWSYAVFPGGLPTRELLDQVVPDRPAYIECYDGRAAWANSKALALAGITRRTPNPKNGVIVKDSKTGEPTGVVKESATELFKKVIPEPTREEKLQALRAAIGEAHRFGVTSVQDAGGGEADLELYDELRKAGDLTVRVYSALSIGSGFSEADADALDGIRRRYPDDPLLKTGAVKIVADGVVETHTAAMLAPYSNKTTTGIVNHPAAELDRVVGTMDRRGWQIMIHATGDGAVRMALDAYEHAAAANPAPPRGRRHRIEHAETIDTADLARFGKLGVVASMQPFRANPGADQMDVWAANVGSARASRAWAWKSILDGGGRLAFGSDWPIVRLDPLMGLHVAVTRTTPAGGPEDGWLPEQRLPLNAALDAYGPGAAYASFDEHRKGSLAPGMLADIAIFSTDIFALPPGRLLDAVVDTTIFDGKVVYTRPPSTTD